MAIHSTKRALYHTKRVKCSIKRALHSTKRALNSTKEPYTAPEEPYIPPKERYSLPKEPYQKSPTKRALCSMQYSTRRVADVISENVTWLDHLWRWYMMHVSRWCIIESCHVESRERDMTGACMSLDSFLCVWLIHIHVWDRCDACVTHSCSCVRHVWLTRDVCVSHLWNICDSFMFMRDTCVTHVWLMCHSCVSHLWDMCHSFMCVWRIHICHLRAQSCTSSLPSRRLD